MQNEDYSKEAAKCLQGFFLNIKSWQNSFDSISKKNWKNLETSNFDEWINFVKIFLIIVSKEFKRNRIFELFDKISKFVKLEKISKFLKLDSFFYFSIFLHFPKPN